MHSQGIRLEATRSVLLQPAEECWHHQSQHALSPKWHHRIRLEPLLQMLFQVLTVLYRDIVIDFTHLLWVFYFIKISPSLAFALFLRDRIEPYTGVQRKRVILQVELSTSQKRSIYEASHKYFTIKYLSSCSLVRVERTKTVCFLLSTSLDALLYFFVWSVIKGKQLHPT